MTDEILNRVRQWEYKYQGKEFVDLHSISLTGRGRHRLENEKAMNLAGMVAGATGGKAAGRSIADAGRNIGEAALKEIVLRLEPNVRMVMDRNRFPLGMRWDFYGIVE
jgi:hypothetical protein